MTELEKGTPIAWIERRHSSMVTTGVSQLHRVYENGQTYCLKPIPDASRHFPPPLAGLKPCKHCDTLYRANATPDGQLSYFVGLIPEGDRGSRTDSRSVAAHA